MTRWMLAPIAGAVMLGFAALGTPAHAADAPTPAITHQVANSELIEIGGAQGYGFWWAKYVDYNVWSYSKHCVVDLYTTRIYNGATYLNTYYYETPCKNRV